MPTLAELDEIRRRNLAREDQTVGRFNSRAAYFPSPGVGQPGSTPETDAANLATATAMGRPSVPRFGFGNVNAAPTRTSEDIINDTIDRRRQMIISGRDPDAPAITPSDRRRKELAVEFHSLSDVRQQGALLGARTAHETFTRENHIRSAEDFSSMANELYQLNHNSKVGIGTPEYHDAALEIAARHPEGLRTQAGTLLFKNIAFHQDAITGIKARSYEQRFNQAFKEASIAARKAGGDVQYDTAGFPSVERTMQAATGSKVAPANNSEITAFVNKLKGLNLKPDDFENPESWQTRKDGKMFKEITLKDGKKDYVTIAPATFDNLQKEHSRIFGAAAATSTQPPTKTQSTVTTGAGAATVAPTDITAEDYSKLKKGDQFWWKGKQITKQ